MSDEKPAFGPVETTPNVPKKNLLPSPSTLAVETGKIYKVGAARGAVIEPGKTWGANVGTDKISLVHIAPVDLFSDLIKETEEKYPSEIRLNLYLSPYAGLYLVLAGILPPFSDQWADNHNSMWDLGDRLIDSYNILVKVYKQDTTIHKFVLFSDKE